ATVSASADSADGRGHFTAANLNSQLHRSIEAQASAHILQRMFNDSRYFKHHLPLPPTSAFGDEGAANHPRFAGERDAAAVAPSVYGRAAGENPPYPARQSQAASRAVARQHELHPERVVLARQNPEAIKAGVFHNDVIAVGHD